jgi:hypothetical protein
MKLEQLVETIALVENAGGEYYLTLPYDSLIGKTAEKMAVKVPIKHAQPTAADKKALVEAATVQGGLGRWIQKDDGSLSLASSDV